MDIGTPSKQTKRLSTGFVLGGIYWMAALCIVTSLSVRDRTAQMHPTRYDFVGVGGQQYEVWAFSKREAKAALPKASTQVLTLLNGYNDVSPGRAEQIGDRSAIRVYSTPRRALNSFALGLMNSFIVFALLYWIIAWRQIGRSPRRGSGP